jgi:hypothetical protein
MACSNCKFFHKTKGDKGTCRRYPPFKWFVGGKWSQPEVSVNDGCGEWQLETWRNLGKNE